MHFVNTSELAGLAVWHRASLLCKDILHRGCNTTIGCELALRRHSGRWGGGHTSKGLAAAQRQGAKCSCTGMHSGHWCSQQRLPGSPIGCAVCSCTGIVAMVSGTDRLCFDPGLPYASTSHLCQRMSINAHRTIAHNSLRLTLAMIIISLVLCDNLCTTNTNTIYTSQNSKQLCLRK